MNVNIRGAIAALAAMVVLAPPVLAQTAGKGSIGGAVGVPFFLADEDTKNGQSPRILGQFQFQYSMSDQNRIAVGAGYGWIGYKAGTPAPYKMFHPGLNDSVQVMDDVLTKFQPVSATFLHAFRPQLKGWVPYAGGGVNLTRIEIVNDRQKIKDPATFDSYVNWSPGLHAQGGFEYFLSNQKVAFDGNVRWAKLFSEDTEQFPSGFTGPHSYFTVNVGVNVYFWPIGHKPIETVPQPVPEAIPAPDSAAAPAPAPPDTSTAPAPVPPPPPPSPTPPDTGSVDTTRTPGSSQAPLHTPVSTILLRKDAAAKPAPVTTGAAPKGAPPVSSVVIERDEDEAAACPAPRIDPSSSGMFGVPGAPVTPPRPPADDAPGPGPEGSPEGHATP